MSILSPISESEKQQLYHCEAVIEKGIQTFIEVGEALLVIREAELYRAQYSTFAQYCQHRWGMSIRQSQRYMSAAKVVQNLKAGDPWVALPTSERQIRSLGSLSPLEQQQVWQSAIADDTPITGENMTARVQAFKQNQCNDIAEKDLSVHFSSDSCEWYTPPTIVEASLKVLGSIDLDPCSNSSTQPNIPAKQHFTKKDDGLSQIWRGKVYLNPPYGRAIKDWIEKLFQQYEAGNITEAIALTPSRTDTQWFYILRTFPRCFIKGRLTFSEVEHAAPFPSVVFYLGKETDKFKQHFQDLGDVYTLI